MSSMLRAFEESDIGGLFFVAAALLFVGNKVSKEYPKIRRLCLSFAGASFVAYLAYCLSRRPLGGPLTETAVRGLIGTGVIIGTSWIVLTPCSFAFAGFATCLHNWNADRRQTAERRRQLRRKQNLQLEYDRCAPERDRAALLAKQHAVLEGERQHRRESARASCEIVYCLYAPEIGSRFSRQMFNDFVSVYMGDNRDPEYVEQRAQQLTETMQKHLEKIEPRKDKRSIEDLARWYQDVREKICAQGVEDKYRNAQLAQLNVRYRTLVQELLEELKP